MTTPTHKPKAIISDVDETLTDRITWYQLTEKLGGSPARHAHLFMQYRHGKMSYEMVKKELFKIWRVQGPVHRDQLREILSQIHIKGEAADVLRNLQKRGYQICLISGSMKMFVEILAEKLNIEYYYGNARFIFDDDGYWVDIEYNKEEGQLKIEQLHDFLEKTGLKKEDCITIGDGDNDIELFQEIPGIVVNANSEHLKELAWQDAKYLPRVLQILESIE